ncbi:hypothetical protein MYCTH_2087774 [Thermothelomyces thermophilus ATCC 42464]|uniref:Uncharacterized protein n=1 Tax=Thermothelomyces thermophilus (strain ATCC 42464 / BCRC 31852 / DSM 1799) TaxID=573729 RepID=G2Q406_THET4|nr:uncharacterized protein MYCTH_2087774 [Thermothelomyces thermophilus ATCC 42464]AEO53605.1 hypothetical protein MYCTH_2087774 [Thermothelomyces thermophilus ATCC 42464]
MDSVSTYSAASLAWLAIQATTLIVWPSLISTLLRADGPAQGAPYGVANSNASLEQYFARSLGLAQLALGSLLLVLSGALPLDSPANPPDNTSNPTPSASAAVLLTTLYHAAAAFYAYTRYHATRGLTAYLLGCLASSVLAAYGLGVLLFAGDRNRRVSRRTGADKSTSGWPFKNAEADKKKKKRS